VIERIMVTLLVLAWLAAAIAVIFFPADYDELSRRQYEDLVHITWAREVLEMERILP
jgi:hypothetical protein